MIIATHSDRRTWLRNAGFVVGVTAAHVLVFAIMADTEPSPPMPLPLPPMQVELVRPAPPPPPPPPPTPASDDPGGGAPAAPSRIHVPPPPPKLTPREVPAPREQAPEPALAVGVAPIASPTPGMGQGGQGTGTGAGTGAGDGPGRGSVRTPPRNLREPRPGDLRRYHPPDALRRGVSGTVVVSCRIRIDTHVDQCRVLSETPAGQGFGASGIEAAVAEYRFRPAMIDGRPDEALRAIITLRFGREAPPVG